MPESFYVNDSSPLLAQGVDCIYCHTDIVLNDHVIVCERCRSPHHVDCWQANASDCATFGCVNVVKRNVASGRERVGESDITIASHEVAENPNAERIRQWRDTSAHGGSYRRYTRQPASEVPQSTSQTPSQSTRSYRPWLSGDRPANSGSNRPSGDPILNFVRAILAIIGLCVTIWGSSGPFASRGPSYQENNTFLTRIAATPISPVRVAPTATTMSRTGRVTGLLKARNEDGELAPLTNEPIGLRRVDFCTDDNGERDAAVYNLSDSYDIVTNEIGVFLFTNITPGRYFLLSGPDDGQLLLRSPGGSEPFVVEVEADRNQFVGTVQYDSLAFVDAGTSNGVCGQF